MLFACGSLISALVIREEDIDHAAARGAMADETLPRQGTGVMAVLRHRQVLMLGATLTLFHFSNAAMLPVVGQYLTIGDKDAASLYMSACIVIAQLVMIPVAWWAGRRAVSWGRRPVFMIGLIALPLRGLLYGVSNDPVWLLLVQALDGIGAGIFGVLGTLFALGAAASNLVAGVVVDASGYVGGFLFLAAFGCAAPLIFWWGVGETRPIEDASSVSV